MNDKMTSNHVISLLGYIEDSLAPLYSEREVQQISSWLFKAYKNWSRADLALHRYDRFTESEILKFHFALKRLKQGEPIQYVIGDVDFMGITLRVNPSVLIPRPETEELVQLILNENKGTDTSVLDMGTGSGCIAIALKKKNPSWEVIGIDKSVNTLSTAESNAQMHKLSMRFLKQDIFETPTFKTKFDIIVSNPPYVLESDKSQMSEMVLKHEPEQALFVPDNDPLLFYRRILELAPTLLNPGGKIYFEIHENKGSEMKALCLASNMSDVRIIQDMQGKERMMSMQFTQ